MKSDKIKFNEINKALTFPISFLKIDKIKNLKIEFDGHQYPQVELTYDSTGKEKTLTYRIRDDYTFNKKG